MSLPRRIPEEIEEKVRMLKHHRDLINELNMKVEMSKRECERLEQELAVYHASVAPIRQVPPEILLDIFKQYLLDNPRLIRRLLLVCRLWHDIVITEPRLWTNVLITFDNENVHAEQLAASLMHYVDACLKHSASLLLNLNIDLEKMIDLYTHVDNRFEVFKDEINGPYWLKGLNLEDLSDWSRGEAWDHSHAIPLIKLLVGEEGKNMDRWYTLSLKLPYFSINHKFETKLWECFSGPTPQLVQLQVHGISDVATEKPVFPDLSSLKSLTITNAAKESGLRIPHGSIQHLTIHFQDSKRLQDYHLEYYMNLLTLEIYTPNPQRVSEKPLITVNLPSLHSLSFLGGQYGSIHGITFVLPSLRNLHIERRGRESFTELPAVDPTSVHWSVIGHMWSSWKLDTKLALRKVLVQYTRMKTLIVSEFMKESLLDAINELREEGRMPCSLNLLRFENDYGVEEMDLRTK